ncbi:unnamed protein product [Discula destructiva]
MASQADQVVLFDLASKQGTSWSLNPWKTRFMLNYKNINYTTKWMEYPDLQAHFEPHIPGGIDGGQYTIPTITLPDGTWHMDSRNIATVLEAKYPQPPLKLDSPMHAKLADVLPGLLGALRGNYLPTIPKRILNEASVPYWYRTREEKVGSTLDELEAKEGGQAGFANAEGRLKAVTEMLKENSEGPFLEGGAVTYADFVWAGFLLFWQRIGDDKFEAILERTGDPKVHLDLLKAVEPWSKRNDH